MALQQPGLGGGGTEPSLELDILALSQRWEARRTIRNGDTPGPLWGAGTAKGLRPALADIANVAAGEAPNPFSLTAQRHKAAASRVWHPQQQQQQQQQPSVRFAVDSEGCAPAAGARQPAGDAENRAPSAAATPAVMPPPTSSKAAAGAAGTAEGGGNSPSPYVLFRGRLSFAAEVDSARMFDRPTTARKPVPTLKRKLLISPGADISAAFPSVGRPAAKQRRRSLGGAGGDCAVPSAAEQAAADAAGGSEGGSAAGEYWSDPLPLPLSGCKAAGQGALVPDSDMLDTAASPASSGGSSACCSPAGGMDACCCRSPAAPSFSTLPGSLQHALPTVEHPDCGFPSITPKTMRDLLKHGAAAYGLTGFTVVDCRYDYEHEGGRIPGAVHLTTPEEVQGFLAGQPEEHWAATALVFHCEFSTERGPRAAKFVRNKDREAHMRDYPALSYPHVFVLQGGYKAFWRACPDLCCGGYTPMDHPDYTEELKVCHNVVKKAWAKTTRTYGAKQQRRPSYRLRQSAGGCSDAAEAVAAVAAEEKAQQRMMPPAVVAAQHHAQARPLA